LLQNGILHFAFKFFLKVGLLFTSLFHYSVNRSFAAQPVDVLTGPLTWSEAPPDNNNLIIVFYINFI